MKHQTGVRQVSGILRQRGDKGQIKPDGVMRTLACLSYFSALTCSEQQWGEVGKVVAPHHPGMLHKRQFSRECASWLDIQRIIKGRAFRSGFVSMIGRPNAGRSTL